MLALGGHILLWSDINWWIQTVSNQLAMLDITNEDMSSSARRYFKVVAELVANRVKYGREAEVGGAEAVAQFFTVVKVGLICLVGHEGSFQGAAPAA